MSIRDHLKPKREESIFNELESLMPQKILKLSVNNGSLRGVKLALTKGADPSASKNAALKLASRLGHLEIVRELLNDPRVRQKLKPKTLDGYNKQIVK
jgi:hypothetical protein